jgi:hypothetical protein
VSNPPFTPGMNNTFTYFIGDPGAPCDGDQMRTITGMLAISP